MPRYLTCVTVTSHRDSDEQARAQQERMVQIARLVFPGSRVDVTTYAEKPLPKARMH